MAEIYRMIGTLTDDQLAAVGMEPAEAPETGTDCRRGYAAFQAWLTRLLAPLDPGADLPARRVTNREHRRQVAARTDEQVEASELALQRLHEIVNALVAASVDSMAPVGYEGDIVADETIVDLAGPSDGLGTKDDKRRSAAYAGCYYVRDGSDNSVHSKFGDVVQFKKSAVGIGVTAVSRVGAPDDLYGVPPVITGVAIHPPTSGSVEGLSTAISYHQAGGFAPVRGPRCRVPYLTTDMGYNVKRGFSSMVLETGYAPVVRYPRHWNTIFASEGAEHTRAGKVDGPVQISGDFYCPAARQIIGKNKLVRKTADLLGEDDGFEVQDRRLEALFPLLMGTNSRPYRARAGRGRPRKDDAVDQSELPVKQDLVCPAVQERVRCPLKPASMDTTDLGIPTVTPTWPAERYRCCSQSQVTVQMSAPQWQRAQWGLVPGSWEHATYFEAARAATEQKFSIMKSQHVTGIEHMKWSPRREPLLCLLIGLWVAATNLAIQDVYDQRPPKPSSVKRRMRGLEADLGRPPTRIPPRT
ncbi:hypothetical protein Csp1_01240 [Corynebacterium provencense]|uniref:Uncharacterized protein n=2 Tax=Corynebacterium provencense TaxID=1737425 RepID=A0A2Z3YM22_9CORY|nr:hypothetical protein Csp1_01240 [Corynebacterium provencense]